MELKELMVEFGKRCGGGDFAPDEEGIVMIGLDDMIVKIREVPELGMIVTYAEICEEPPEDTGDLAKAMLQANYLFRGTAGAALAQDAETGMYYLNRSDDMKTLDGDSFFAMIERFTDTLEVWRTLVKDYRGPEKGDTALSMVENAQNGLMNIFGESFMRV